LYINKKELFEDYHEALYRCSRAATALLLGKGEGMDYEGNFPLCSNFFAALSST
jgi:hypothetical protein